MRSNAAANQPAEETARSIGGVLSTTAVSISLTDKKKEKMASRRGPFLIAWAPSDSRFLPDELVLVFDL